MQTGILFAVTAHHSTGHGDSATTYCITSDGREAYRQTCRAEELGYEFHSMDTGVVITVLEPGRAYRKDEFKSHDHLPVPADFPVVLFRRKTAEGWQMEWREDTRTRYAAIAD